MNQQSTPVRVTWILLLIATIAGLTTPGVAMGSSQSGTLLRNAGASQAETELPADPAAILAAARIIYVCSRTGFIKSEVIEN